MAVKTASGFGVTSPSNNVRIDSGKNGVRVSVGVFDTAGVNVMVGGTVSVGVNVMVGVRVMVGVKDGVSEGGKYP